MGKKPCLVAMLIRWLSSVATLLVLSSPSGDAVDAFEFEPSRTRCMFSLKLPYGERPAGFTIGSLPVERRCIAKEISHPDYFVRPTEKWFHNYLSLSKSEQRKIYSRLPNGIESIQRLGRHRLHEWLAFFLSDMVGMDHYQLRKMIISRPQLLTYKLPNVQSTTSYFREELGFSSNEFASILQKYPSVLMYSIDKRLRPTVDFLQNECGGGRDNWTSWKRVIFSYPNIFSYSPEKTLFPKVLFLCNREDEKSLGLSRSELSQVVSKFPPTLWLSHENLQAKLDFLSESLNLDGFELQSIIVSYPQILGLSLQNLWLKMEFFLDGNAQIIEPTTLLPHGYISEQKRNDPNNCGLTKDQLKEFVLYQPALLAYSLENRLKPRITRMKEKNIFFVRALDLINQRMLHFIHCWGYALH